jgi:chromatin remodeling complex protein RSC6
MVRAAKNVSTATATPTPTPSANVASTPTKAPRAKKVAAVKETAQTVESTVVDVAPVAVAPVVEESAISTKMLEYGAKLQQSLGLLTSLKNDFKNLEKAVSREMKSALKASAKKRRTSGNRQPSGFVKPTRISDELAEFLGKAVGTEMARTSVSKEINAYIRANNLQDEKNGRKINPDNKLSNLLKLSNEDELTYFNLQKFMKHHFIKAVPVVSATA